MTFKKQFKKSLKLKLIYFRLRFKNYNLNDAILIFSEARGGSTWLMELLKNIPGTVINWEPLHVNNGVVPKEFKFGWRPHIPIDNDSPKYLSLFASIFKLKIYNKWTTRYIFWVDLKNSKHVLTKFVRANQSLSWVVHKFPDLMHKPILLFRHPITTCMSRLKTFDKISSKHIMTERKNEDFKIPDCINNERFTLHEDYLNSLNTKLEVEIAIWCINNVNLITHVDRNKWQTVFYEDLVLYPETTFKALLKGIDIHLSNQILENINYRSASVSNYHGDLKAIPENQLESFLKQLTKEELQRIQAIFDYFNLKTYSAFNAYPIKDVE